MKVISKPLLRSMIVCLLTCMVTGAIIITPLFAQPQDKGFVVAKSDQASSLTLGICWALLVGIADYPQVEGFEIQPLKSPVKDVNNLAAFLKSPRSGGCFDDEHVFTLTDSEATRRNILTTFNKIAMSAAPEDLVLFYFSGHGTYYGKHDTTYLIPYDPDLTDLETTCINFYDLSRKIRDMEASKVVVILDACHAGGVKPEGSRAGAAGYTGLVKSYYEAFQKAEGRALLLSSDEKEVSLEEEEGGVFTQFLLEALRGKADENNDGIITFAEVARYVEDQVPRYTFEKFSREQQPIRRYELGPVLGDIPMAINWDAHDEFRQKLKDQLDKRSEAILLASLEGLDDTLKEFSLQIAKSAHDKALEDEELTKRESLLLKEMDLLQSGKITVADYIQRARLIYNMGAIPDADRVEQVLEPEQEIPPVREETPSGKVEISDDTPDDTKDDAQKSPTFPAPERRVTSGLKVGLNLSSYYGDDAEVLWDEYWGPKLGFCGGIFITFRISDIFTIQPEALFAMKGAKEEHEDWSQKINANYLEIPLLAKLSIPGRIIKPNLFFGPALAIKLSSARIYDSGDSEPIDYFKETDLGAVFGLGADFNTGRGNIMIEVRYTLGLITVKDEEGYDIKNGVISFMAGYSF